MPSHSSLHRLLLAAIAVALTTSAPAIMLTAEPNNNFSNAEWWGNQSKALSVSQVESEVGASIGSLLMYYKAEADPTGEEGDLAGSYQSTWEANLDDGVTVSYSGSGDIISGAMYAVAKDGKSGPNWFIWDLSDLGWNGVDDLEFKGPIFYKKDGGTQNFSYVALYGTTTMPENDPDFPSTVLAPVPDGGTSIALLGLALLGLGGAKRAARRS